MRRGQGRTPQQLPLHVRGTWGGWRPRAGRKPSPGSGIAHLPRERFAARHPVHVTLRVRDDVPSLRSVRLVREFERSLHSAREQRRFRVVHYSLQGNHAHLLVEAAGPDALGRGMKSIGARLARAVNRVFRRRGPVLADRYHARVLRTPKEMRRALAYVLLNGRRHARRRVERVRRLQDAPLDPASSARWFDGWRTPVPSPRDPPVVAAPHSWLLRKGWRRHGRLSPWERPGPTARRARSRRARR